MFAELHTPLFTLNSRQFANPRQSLNFYLPCSMEIILQIPAQAATQGVPRQMTVSGIDFQGAVIAEARDAQLPATLRFTEKDNFPWDQFLQQLSVFWTLSREFSIPKAFRLGKRLPESVTASIPHLDRKDALALVKALGAAGFISAFSKLRT